MELNAGKPAFGEYIELRGIRFTAGSVATIEKDRAVIILHKNDIESLTLRYGLSAQQPRRQTIIGLVLTAIGSVPLFIMILWIAGTVEVGVAHIMLVWLFFIGLYFIGDARREGCYLEVLMKTGARRKLRFDTKANENDTIEFVGEATFLIQMPIDVAIVSQDK